MPLLVALRRVLIFLTTDAAASCIALSELWSTTYYPSFATLKGWLPLAVSDEWGDVPMGYVTFAFAAVFSTVIPAFPKNLTPFKLKCRATTAHVTNHGTIHPIDHLRR